MNHSVQQQANKLLKVARRNDIEPYRALEALLDYLIGVFEVSNLEKFNFDYSEVFKDAKQRNEDMFSLLADWFQQVTEEMETGQGFLDWFGAVYEEMFQGRSKASALGQFFTPESLCHMMAKMIKPDGGRSNDCACGSGRTMLAAFAENDRTKFQWYEAGDVDYTSCKMCALNFMIHGMLGIVKRQDALMWDTPAIIYHINEVRWPIPSNMYSIRIEYPKREEKPVEKKKEVKQPVQLSLFD